MTLSLAAAAAVEDEDMALGIDCDARCLAHISVGGQLEEIWHRLVGDLRRSLLLGNGGCIEQRENDNEQAFHSVLP